MKRLNLLSKCCRWMCWLWGRRLAINKWLMEHDWLSFDRDGAIRKSALTLLKSGV